MVEGPNFCFGRNRSGTVDDLQKYCRQEGLELEIVPPVFVGTRMVSSTAIRRLILAGDVEQANELLGHPCEIIGRVSKGAGRGRLIGFPTANVTDTVTVMPRDGVYAGVARIPGETAEACQTGETEPTRGTGPNEEHFWPAAINIGPNPTFGEHGRKLEVHLIGFAGDLYGCRLQIEFVARLRETRQFPDAEALQTQLEQDITQARAVVSRVLTR